MSTDTRTVDWDLFIMVTNLVLAHSIFVLKIEADIANKDRSATRVVLNNVEDRGLFPSPRDVIEITEAQEVSDISIANIRVSPSDILFSARFSKCNIGRPPVNITVEANGEVWKDDWEFVAANVLDLAPHPTFD